MEANHKRPWRLINELHLHVTTACNLCCRYCYADADVKNDGQFMSEQVAIKAIGEVLHQTSAQYLHVIFHGGEPLLLPENFYETVCTYAETLAQKKGVRLTLGMQTNLTLLTEPKASILSKHSVKLGTSIDGPQQIHDAFRGAYVAVIAGMEIARSHGIFSGPIVVIHSHNFDRMFDVLDNFRRLKISSVHCNIGAAVGRGATKLYSLSSEQIFIAFRNIFEYMLQSDFQVIDTRVLMMVEREIFRRHSRDRALLSCSTPFCHAGITMIAVDVDGSVFPCGCATANAALMPFRIARIGDPMSYDRERFLRFHHKPLSYTTVCTDCPARFVCSHGCPAFDATDLQTASSICEATRLFHEFLISRPRDIERYRTFLNHHGVY